MNQGRPNWNYAGPRYRMEFPRAPWPIRRPAPPPAPRNLLWQSSQQQQLPLHETRSRPLLQSLFPPTTRHPGPRFYRPRGPRPLLSIAPQPVSVEECRWQAGNQRPPDSNQGLRRLRQPPPLMSTHQWQFPAPNEHQMVDRQMVDHHMVDTDCQQGRPYLMETPTSHAYASHRSHASIRQASPRALLETVIHHEQIHQEPPYPQPDQIVRGDNRPLDFVRRQSGHLNYQSSGVQAFLSQASPPRPPPPPLPKIETVNVEELFDEPERSSRPSQFVIILRGPPGTGKSHVAKLLKDKEVQHNGVSIRILSLDDYFLTDIESVSVDPETGKKSKKKSIDYCYDAEMEQLYKDSLFKSFCKTLDDPDFSIVIVDSVNHKLADFERFWSHAKVKGYEVFIAELMSDINECVAQSAHGRSHNDIAKIIREWQPAPSHYKRLDVRSLHQEVVINEVEMEIGENAYAQLPRDYSADSEDVVKSSSRWEAVSDDQLDALDGVRKSLKRKREADSVPLGNIEDFLQSCREVDTTATTTGAKKKRVHWADIEEKKQQERQRKIGFVIGQNWSNLTPDSAVIDKLLTGNDP
ncbi:YLP motif-containing protein 1-like [Corticium candelabrum]|uniref:YLP motif-containing protein 1-like n=1 Tax=Corticium candelabrum TaxID=121492 RepID=UPI002E25D52A|nr:YLP motif-containing protein 1-like [Corticium candelabrum]